MLVWGEVVLISSWNALFSFEYKREPIFSTNIPKSLGSKGLPVLLDIIHHLTIYHTHAQTLQENLSYRIRYYLLRVIIVKRLLSNCQCQTHLYSCLSRKRCTYNRCSYFMSTLVNSRDVPRDIYQQKTSLFHIVLPVFLVLNQIQLSQYEIRTVPQTGLRRK